MYDTCIHLKNADAVQITPLSFVGDPIVGQTIFNDTTELTGVE